MSGIRLFYRKDGATKVSRSLDFLKKTPTDCFLWIDLCDVDEEIEAQLEDFLKIYIQEEEEMVEIEMTSRYIETADTLVVNSNFLTEDYVREPVSFILKNDILISTRNTELPSFQETVMRLSTNQRNFPTGYHVFMSLFETRVEIDADMIEKMDNAARTDAEKEEFSSEYDPRLPEAVEIVVEAGQASVSMLQRRMRVGYARAGRLIDEMEQRGIVSEADGAKPRTVLITREEMNEMFEEEE
jgi:DNA segregation ATPase FtsK/SpoIIIE-like protein